MTEYRLEAIIRDRSSRIQPSELDSLIKVLLEKHGSAINTILFYGSCLRNGNLFDGLVDLYLIVDDYQAFYPTKWQPLVNWLLPPNVFYTEVPAGDNVIRTKYAILSSEDFSKGTSKRWFHSYLWGRFTQPVALAYVKDRKAKQETINNLAQAIRTFLTRVLPHLPASSNIRELWIQGLQLSYRAELRPESKQRSTTLIDHELDYYSAITMAAAPSMPFSMTILEDKRHVQTSISKTNRFISRISWPIRQLQGKFLSVVRLLKALFTFEGGLDYIAWKLERHSGQSIDIPERVRRYPLIFIWGLFWRLHRRGLFR